MTEEPVYVVMTEAGWARTPSGAVTIQDVLESVYEQCLRGRSDCDRPSKLFVNGECILAGGLADLAIEYGRYRDAKHSEASAACDVWVAERFSKTAESEAA